MRGVVETTVLATSLISHLGWWLDWQTRSNAGQGSKPLD